MLECRRSVSQGILSADGAVATASMKARSSKIRQTRPRKEGRIERRESEYVNLLVALDLEIRTQDKRIQSFCM